MNQPAHYVSPNDLGPTIPSSNPQRSTLTSSAINYKLSTINFRKGFSFAEVMFAVVILGIGFILIAAIFPVAIQQSQATAEESSAAAIARQAAAAIASLPTTLANPIYTQTNPVGPSNTVQTELVFPPTVKPYVPGNGTIIPVTVAGNFVLNGVTQSNLQGISVAPPAVVIPLVGTQWDLIKANVILPSDPRYAYAAFYKRENNSSVAEVIVVATIVRNRPVYSPAQDEVFSPGPVPVTMQTTPADFPTASAYTAVCPDTVTVNTGNVLEGFYLQVPANAATPPTPIPLGRTYLLGRSISTGTFEMMAGDCLGLTAGTSGLWGTAGRITDASSKSSPPLTSIPARLYPTSTLQATVAYAQFRSDPGAPGGRIFLSTGPGPEGSGNPPPPAAAPGAFVIVADDYPMPGTPVSPTTSAPAQPAGGGPADYNIPPNVAGFYTVGAMNGRIFRLGKAVTEDFNEVETSAYVNRPGTFDLDPQYGMRPPPQVASGPNFSPDVIPNPASGETSYYAKVYIIGAGRADPTTYGPNAVYLGGAQDIGCFATYIQVQ